MGISTNSDSHWPESKYSIEGVKDYSLAREDNAQLTLIFAPVAMDAVFAILVPAS
jgi:hypothetical protein